MNIRRIGVTIGSTVHLLSLIRFCAAAGPGREGAGDDHQALRGASDNIGETPEIQKEGAANCVTLPHWEATDDADDVHEAREEYTQTRRGRFRDLGSKIKKCGAGGLGLPEEQLKARSDSIQDIDEKRVYLEGQLKQAEVATNENENPDEGHEGGDEQGPASNLQGNTGELMSLFKRMFPGREERKGTASNGKVDLLTNLTKRVKLQLRQILW